MLLAFLRRIFEIKPRATLDLLLQAPNL